MNIATFINIYANIYTYVIGIYGENIYDQNKNDSVNSILQQIFLLLELSFFRFQYRLSFLSICFASTFTFFKSLSNVFKRLLIFREILNPQAGAFDFQSCLQLVPFQEVIKMISKTSHRCSKFFAVVRNERLHSTRWLLFFLLSLTFTFKYIIARNISHHMNGLFLIPWYGRHKEGVQQTISLQVV